MVNPQNQRFLVLMIEFFETITYLANVTRSTSRGCLRFSAGARVDLVTELAVNGCVKDESITSKHKGRVQAKSADDEERPADELEEDGCFGFLNAVVELLTKDVTNQGARQ